MLLAHDLRSLQRHDPRATQRVVRVAERQPGDVREAPVVSRDEPAADTLDRVAAGLVRGLAARDVVLDLAQRELAERDPRPDSKSDASARRGDDHDLGAHLVLTTRKAREHRDGIAIVLGFADGFPVDLHLGVRGERDRPGPRDGIGLCASR